MQTFVEDRRRRVDSAVLAGKAALLYDNAVAGQVVSAATAALMVWVLGHDLPAGVVFGWWAAIMVTVVWRLILVRAWRRARPAEAEAASWVRRFVAAAGASGAVWAAGVIGFTLGADYREQLFVGFVAAGLVAGGMPLLSPVFAAFAAFAAPIAVALAFAALAQAHDALGWALGLMVVVFLYAVLRSARAMQATLDDSLRLAHEEARLVAELDEAKRAAEESSRAKTAFLANVSHEIRTPMNGVLGMTDMLMDTPLSAEQREFTGVIRDSARSLLSVIDEILDLAELEAGRLALRQDVLSLPDLLRQITEGARTRASARGLEFRMAVSSDVPTFVEGDAARLKQVIETLIGNALKFTPQGHVELEVQADGRPAAGRRLRFEVRDTGIGIPPERIGGLFTPFTQADGSATRSYGGAGLGLAIAKRLVALMGGEIGVDSLVGKGSRFWFSAVFREPAGENPDRPA